MHGDVARGRGDHRRRRARIGRNGSIQCSQTSAYDSSCYGEASGVAKDLKGHREVLRRRATAEVCYGLRRDYSYATNQGEKKGTEISRSTVCSPLMRA